MSRRRLTPRAAARLLHELGYAPRIVATADGFIVEPAEAAARDPASAWDERFGGTAGGD